MESSKHQAAHFSDRRDLLEAPEGEGYFTDTGQIREIYSAVPCLLNKVSVEQPRARVNSTDKNIAGSTRAQREAEIKTR